MKPFLQRICKKSWKKWYLEHQTLGPRIICPIWLQYWRYFQYFFSKWTLFLLGMDTFYYTDSMSSDKALRVARLRDFLFVLGAVVCVCIVMYCLVLGLIIVLLPSISFTEEKYVRRRRLFWLMRINPQNSLFDRHVKYGVEKGLQVRSNSTHTTTIEVTQDY